VGDFVVFQAGWGDVVEAVESENGRYAQKGDDETTVSGVSGVWGNWQLRLTIDDFGLTIGNGRFSSASSPNLL
jgi:hypothetical protein